MQVAPSAMAGHSIATSSSDRAGVLAAFKSAWADYRHQVAQRQEVREAIAKLADLDDVALADMGIYRSQIEDIVTGGKR